MLFVTKNALVELFFQLFLCYPKSAVNAIFIILPVILGPQGGTIPSYRIDTFVMKEHRISEFEMWETSYGCTDHAVGCDNASSCVFYEGKLEKYGGDLSGNRYTGYFGICLDTEIDDI